MKKFCERCGKPLLKSGKCVDCDKVDTKVKKKSRVWIPIVVSISVVAVAAAAVAIVLSMGNGKNGQDGEKKGSNGGSTTPTFDLSVPYEVTPADAKATIESFGNILSSTPAQESEQVQSESDAVVDFSQRCFGEMEILAEYDMSGEYTNGNYTSYYSDDCHPVYSTYYTAANGEIWGIMSVNGVLMAQPLSYNYAGDDANRKPVIVTETDSFFSYDGNTNTFFDVAPDSSKIKLMKVSFLDSEALDDLTSDKLGG